MQPLARPSEPHVGQTPFLFKLLVVTQRPHVREGAVLQAGEENDRELQTLSGVKGHQSHHTVVGRVGIRTIGDLVGISYQRDPLKEGLQ